MTALLTLMAASLLVSLPVVADEDDWSVARVSYVNGDVSYQRGDNDGWNDLRRNTPLVTGDSCYAAAGGRVELDLGSGIFVRADAGTQVQLINNSRDVAQLGIDNGSVDVSARYLPRDFTLEIDTPSGAATLNEPGRYLVDVEDDFSTYSVVRGSMSIAIYGEQLDVDAGESVRLHNDSSYDYGRLPRRTAFHNWGDTRDTRYDRSMSSHYVNESVIGTEDLDDYGTWRDNRQYGRVWVPSRVSRDWAPYREGRWIWQDPYGWTWVSYEPWGWAPYHYGRWIRVGYDWCWVPPPPRSRYASSPGLHISAAYAPALVAFVGGSNWGVSLSLGGPAIGWVPLAPAERYYYPWQPAPRVVNNYTNITVINAVTVVNYNTFVSGQVRPLRVDTAQIQRAPVMGFAPYDITPRRESLVVAQTASAAPRPAPRTQAARPMVTRLVPPPKPEPFVQKVAQIEKTGRPVTRPVARDAQVGKPFVAGTRAPAGVAAVSALEPTANKELKPRGTAAPRPPKKIQRDIAPPPASAARTEPPPTATDEPPVAGKPKGPSPQRRKPERVEAPPPPTGAPLAKAEPPQPAPVEQPRGAAPPPPDRNQGRPPQAAPKKEKAAPQTQQEQTQPPPPERRQAPAQRPPEAVAPPPPERTQGKPPQAAPKKDQDAPLPQQGQAQTPPQKQPKDKAPPSKVVPPPPPAQPEEVKKATPPPPETPEEAKKKKAKGKAKKEEPPPEEPPAEPPPEAE